MQKSQVIIVVRWHASCKRMIFDMLDGCQDWAWFHKMVREHPIVNLCPGPQSAQDPEPSGFSIFPSTYVFCPESIYDIYQQVRLRVTGTSKMGGHWWLLSTTTDDVKSVAIHSFFERLSRLTHILETTLPAFYLIYDIVGFTWSMYFDGEVLVNEIPGNFSCCANHCKTCPILKTMSVFVSKATGERFTIKIHALCKTNNIVNL